MYFAYSNGLPSQYCHHYHIIPTQVFFKDKHGEAADDDEEEEEDEEDISLDEAEGMQ